MTPATSTHACGGTGRRDRVAIAIIALGIVLRVVQYVHNRSLWADEVLLALNISQRSLTDLFVSLDRNQVAPFGFLLVERWIVLLLGNGERALRLIPLVAGLAAVPLFWALSRRVMDRTAARGALAMFSLAQPLIYLTSEVKQYSTDICVAIVVMWLALLVADRRPTRREVVTGAVVGAAAGWISHPAAFVRSLVSPSVG